MGNELGSSRADENKPGEARSLQRGDGGRYTGNHGNNDDHVVRGISLEDTHPSFRSLYRLGPKIGEGSHSQVFLAVERATGRRVAAKAVHTDWLDRRRVEFLRAEIEIHQEVSVHPYIVRLLGFYDDPDACFIVEEVAEGGSLLAHLHARSTMGTEREVRLLLRRLLAALQFLHDDRGIVHRDVKPENLLLMGNGMWSAKLADFGFAVRLDGQETTTGPACGTPEYVAPEILLQQPFSGKADIWSSGVTAFCLLSGVMPFHAITVDKLYSAILDGACSYSGPEWRRVSPKAIDFVRRMLEVDVEGRWAAAQLLDHPWMTDGMVPKVVPKSAGGGQEAVPGTGRAIRRPRVRLKGAVLAIVFVNSMMKRASRGGKRRRREIFPRIVHEVQEHEQGSP